MQCQGQIAIFKIDKSDFVLYTKKNFKIHDVSFDADNWEKLKKTTTWVLYWQHGPFITLLSLEYVLKILDVLIGPWKMLLNSSTQWHNNGHFDVNFIQKYIKLPFYYNRNSHR